MTIHAGINRETAKRFKEKRQTYQYRIQRGFFDICMDGAYGK